MDRNENAYYKGQKLSTNFWVKLSSLGKFPQTRIRT